jgi:hypothetical protein
VKYLLEAEGFTNEIKEGFLLCLLCSDRPINELVRPNFQDQRSAHANQFAGMTDERFSYEDFEATRETLVETVNAALTEKDKAFLLSVKDVNPDWNIYDFQRFPFIKWKLQNLQKLKSNNLDKHKQQFEKLKEKLNRLCCIVS